MSAMKLNQFSKSSSKPLMTSLYDESGRRKSIYKPREGNLKLDLLNEHSTKNNANFFHLLDEAQEAWKDKLTHLEFKGTNQKKNLKDQMKREIDVLSTQVEKETKDRDTIEKQLSNEDKLIQDLNIKLKYATTYFQSIQDNINIENRAFT